MPPPASYSVVLYDATLVSLAASPHSKNFGGDDGGSKPTCGDSRRSGALAMNDLQVKHRFGVAVDASGTISHVMPTGALRSLVKELKDQGVRFDREIECAGRAVLPGLVDCHTHAVHAGDRSQELAAKLAGESYESITAKGGGIHFTVGATRKASEQELAASLRRRLDAMLVNGTTCAEVKSGYGLDLETELKMLRAIQTVARTHPVRVVSTFLGAHAVPRGTTSEEATRAVVEEMIPAVAKANEDGETDVTLIDVFCERGFFDEEQSLQIMEAGREAGLLPAFHGDELNDMNSGVLAARCGAASVSHLEKLNPKGIKAMAEHNVVGVLLPTTAFLLRLTPPPARDMIDAGVAVAIGTDFNPNAPTCSMPATMNLASVTMRLTMEESLVGATINSAAAIGVADTVGSIEVGKKGDFLLLSTPVWEHVVYLGLGGMLTSPMGANLSGQVSTGSPHVIEEVIVGGVCAARNGIPAEAFAPRLGRVEDLDPAVPDLTYLTQGIVVDPLPVNTEADREDVPHAPKRPFNPTPEDDKQALANALRYFPESVHEELAAEFLAELREHGHIYMYRFRPDTSVVGPMKAWPVEAYPAKCRAAASIMLMIMNNLDNAVAQYPHELITYGGNGSAFQNWAQFRIVMKLLSEMSEEQTLVMYSGHPLGLFPSPKHAPRMIITNGMVIPNYSTPEDYERMYYLGVSQYGQMTAGSFCYIGPQGIVHGTTLTLLNAGRRYLGVDDLGGKVFLTSGLGGMSGAQAKASVICNAIGVIVEVSEAALAKRHEQGWLTERIDNDTDALVNRVRELRSAGAGGVSIGFLGNVAEVWERFADIYTKTGELLVDLGSDQTSCHIPYQGGYWPADMSLEEAQKLMSSNPATFKEAIDATLKRQIAAINKLSDAGLYFFDYGNALLINAYKAGADLGPKAPTTFRYPSYVEHIMGDIFSLGFGPYRWVCTSGREEDLDATDKIAEQVMARLLEECDLSTEHGRKRKGCFQDNVRWIREAKANQLVVGSQARILYADKDARTQIALAMNEAVRNGTLQGPVVISRDHHDVSGTDSPFRETSNIYDGSQFTADMAVQNCIGDSFRGATWVALHNGGGCGWGLVMNGGFGMVLDGSDEAAGRAEGMLHWDVMNGITRRAWSANQNAIDTSAREARRNPAYVPTMYNKASSEMIDRIVGA